MYTMQSVILITDPLENLITCQAAKKINKINCITLIISVSEWHLNIYLCPSLKFYPIHIELNCFLP